MFLGPQNNGTKKIMYTCGGHSKPHEVDANYILEPEPKVSRVSCHARRPLATATKSVKITTPCRINDFRLTRGAQSRPPPRFKPIKKNLTNL